jgi:hypothetical protein
MTGRERSLKKLDASLWFGPFPFPCSITHYLNFTGFAQSPPSGLIDVFTFIDIL